MRETAEKSLVSSGNIINVEVDKISLNPYQPRKSFDPISISELAQSIKEYGVIQPITVRRNYIGGYELVSGERRLRASKAAGCATIPCILIEVDENDSAIIALLENLQRADLTFMEEADAISHLVEEHNYTQEQLARKLGKSQSAIANKLRLLRLSPEVKRVLCENGLTERHARALLKIPDEQIQLKILKAVCENSCNVVQTEELVAKTLDKITSEKEREKETPGSIKGVVQLRMLVNSINKAVDVVRKAGVHIEASKIEKGDFIQYLIKIPKNGENIQI